MHGTLFIVTTNGQERNLKGRNERKAWMEKDEYVRHFEKSSKIELGICKIELGILHNTITRDEGDPNSAH